MYAMMISALKSLQSRGDLQKKGIILGNTQVSITYHSSSSSLTSLCWGVPEVSMVVFIHILEHNVKKKSFYYDN